jgi:signal transduction histidine kinase
MSFVTSWVLALWLSLLPLWSSAALLTPDVKEANLLESVKFLEDPGARLTLQDVQAMDHRFQSWDRGGTDLNFGFTDSAYWVRIALQRTELAPKNWLLEVSQAQIGELDVFFADGTSVHTGRDKPLSTRTYFDHFFVFPLDVGQEPQYVYLRAASTYALSIPLKIYAPAHRQEKQQIFFLLQFGYYGSLLALVIYGLIIYGSLRDERFLLYSIYTLAVGLGNFAGNGFGRLLIWPEAHAFDGIAQSFILSLAAYFFVAFARKILFSKTERSGLTRALLVSQVIFLLVSLLLLVGLLVPSLIGWAGQTLMANSLVMSVFMGMASVQALRQGRQGVRFFLIGWLILWLGIAVAALRAFGWVPSNPLTFYAVQISTAFEMFLMALALGDILRQEGKDHEATQQQALLANQSLLAVTRASEDRLKQAVAHRTAALELSLETEKALREKYVRFGSMISHEFRTPLGIIQGQASLMRKEHEHGINQTPKRLEAILGATRRLTVMFDKWLQSDAITNTLEALDRKPLALGPWLRTFLNTSPHLLVNHRAQLRLSAGSDQVMADEYHLGIALTNLVDNAAKYAPANTLILIETRHGDGVIGLCVTDQGPGIEASLHDKVFADFVRLSPESSVRGVGLGLPIVQRIARAHGGHVELTSSPGAGSTFCIWLPSYLPGGLP